MSLPKHRCLHTEKKDCRICGPWLGWVNLDIPGRPPTAEQWSKCCIDMQARHDAKILTLSSEQMARLFSQGKKAEADPSGKSAHTPGAKLDAGKNRLGLVLGGFANALWAVGEVGTFGANKYTPNGWKTVENGVERYTDAMLRHKLKEDIGELKDADSELLHAAHLAWNALARLELMILNQRGVKDEDGKNS